MKIELMNKSRHKVLLIAGQSYSGKTLLSHRIAKEFENPLFKLSLDFMEMKFYPKNHDIIITEDVLSQHMLDDIIHSSEYLPIICITQNLELEVNMHNAMKILLKPKWWLENNGKNNEIIKAIDFIKTPTPTRTTRTNRA